MKEGSAVGKPSADPRVRLDVTLLPGAERVAFEHRAAGAQPDNLCGPYWVSTLLRSVGRLETRGAVITPEVAAVAAGTRIPAEGDPSTWLPRGERSNADYSLPIPAAQEAASSGTSVEGLILAVDELSAGTFRLVPVKGSRDEPFDAACVERLVDLLFRFPAWKAVPILNLRTGKLWGTHASPTDVLSYVLGATVEPPPSEWDVGHFVTVAGTLRGPARSLVLVLDTYPSLGWGGHHVQPFDAVAAALRRDDGREGGCLLFLDVNDVPEAERELKEAGFDIGVWDNGTPREQGG